MIINPLSRVLGNAGDGAPDLPTLFSQYTSHDIDHPYAAPIAIARAGGEGGSVFVYSDADEAPEYPGQSGSSSFAGGGRQWF
jgi:hypothetical protein